MITRLIFFPSADLERTPRDLGLSYENILFQVKNNIRLHGWFLPREKPRYALLFLHGNAGNISDRLEKARGWVHRNVSVLLLDYRGYGKSQGQIKHGDDLIKDGEAAVKWLCEKKNYSSDQIILYGESIGAVPAIELASREKFKAIILEAPFTYIKELAKKHYGMAPDFMLQDFLMDNESKISGLKSPIFILHGTEDEVVPFEMGNRLFQKAPAPKQFLAISGAHHNDITDVGGSDFYEKPFRFVTNELSG